MLTEINTRVAGIPAVARANNFKDLTGQKFGRWTVKSLDGTVGEDGNRVAVWLCLCECGNERVVRGSDLRKGASKSCGCLRGEQLANRLRKHGLHGTDEYNIWKGIRKRCFNPNTIGFDAYSQRAPECWETFDEFFADMGPRPSKRHSIERIDNGKPYSKQNCRWALPAEQCRNKANNRLFTHNGETKCLADWAITAGMNPSTLLARVSAGWDFHAAITKPLRRRA